MLRGRSGAEGLLRALPFLIMAAVAACYVVAAPAPGISPLLSLGPAFAALTGGIRHTLMLSAAALALCTSLAAWAGLLAARDTMIAFVTIAGVTVAGLIATSVRRRRERELTEVRAIADVAQRVLLRPVPRQVGRVGLAVRYISASAGASIGGDLYDVVVVGNGLRLMIGDVEGKGLQAAQVAAGALGAFREAVYDADSLPEIADLVETSLGRHLAEEQFVTAVFAEVSGDGGTIRLLNCGHPPPLLLSGSAARFAEPPHAGLPLGMADLGAGQRQQTTLALAPGDAMIFYTDGISEARARDGRFYPLRSRVLRGTRDPDIVLGYLADDVQRYVGHPLDDDAATLMISFVH